MLRGVADSRHDSGGRSQHQRAGAEHDQDRHCADDLPGEEPRQRCGGQGDDHDPRGPAVGNADDLRLARVRRLHQPDHPLDGAVLPYLGGFHFKRAELVDRTAGHEVPHGLIHRQGFAGHHGLIDGSLTGNDHAVHGNAFTGQHTNAVAYSHLLGGDDLLPALPQHPRRLRGQMNQLLDPGPGLRHGQFFQQGAQLHNERHLAGGKFLPDADRGDQRQRYQHVRLNVKGRQKPDDRFQNDGQTA